MQSTRQSRFHVRALAGALGLSFLLAAVPGTAVAEKPESEEEKTFYFLGTALTRNLEVFQLSEDEQKLVVQGFLDALDGKAMELDEQTYVARMNELGRTRMAQRVEQEKAAAGEFLASMAAEKGATTTDSGLIYTEIEAGSGDSPAKTDTVRVHYHGTLRDGTVFDSSVDRGQPMEFPLNRVIPCWTEGVGLMKPGGKAKLVCPSDIAYGDRGSPPRIPGGAPLVFEVELLEIVQK